MIAARRFQRLSRSTTRGGSRPGTAAEVTLGLGVSVGGLAAPLLALIANSHGPRGALLALPVVPPLAITGGLLLRDARQPDAGL
jgi:MFS transporter, FSR family, fosmidomycin resistance protein